MKSGIFCKRFFYLLSSCLFVFYFSNAATCVSTGNGNWANSGTWSCGSVPTCGDSVVILAGHSVTISAQQDLRGCGSPLVLVINGALRFVTGNKLRLACNSRVYIFETGSLVPGGGGGSPNELEICNNTVWQASDGTFTGPRCLPSTLTACATVLPIKLLYFKSTHCVDNQLCFEWSTASEYMNRGFELEGSSNGLDFHFLKFIVSKGNGHETWVYRVSIPNSTSDEYFRINQTDYNGEVNHSKIIHVISKKELKYVFMVNPNPNNGQFYVQITSDLRVSASAFHLKIYSMSGKLVFERVGHWDINQKELLINTGDQIPKGLYSGHLNYDGNLMHTKIIID